MKRAVMLKNKTEANAPVDTKQYEMDLREDQSEKVHYNTKEYPIYSARGFLSTYPNYSASPHWHEDIELIAVLSGTMDYHVNGEVLTLRAGEGLYVNSRQIHFGFSKQRQECDFLCILLHPKLLNAFSANEYRFVHPLIQNPSIPYVHLTGSSSWEKDCLQLILKMYDHCREKTGPLLIQSDLFLLWSILWDHLNIPPVKSTRENEDLSLAKQMVGFIQKEYKRSLPLSEIAASGNVGQSKCCQVFRQFFHQSPVAYLNQYRLDQSISLLKQTNLSVTEIALSTGFNGASYYTELFHRYTGLTPTQYRKADITDPLLSRSGN